MTNPVSSTPVSAAMSRSFSQVFWQATRPRTFPLAAASIICGNGLAYASLQKATGQSFSKHQWLVFVLTLWVALALQVLSNLANDYGDGVKGTDGYRDACSPKRVVGQGGAAAQTFKRLIYGWAILTFASGVLLIAVALQSVRELMVFLALGIVAIAAAMAYTMGKKPYGYRALGEVAVLVFFGWLGVLGSYYLQMSGMHRQSFSWVAIVPATGCGLLAACVLYVNNMRDVDADKQAGKLTVAGLLGRQKMAVGYLCLLVGAVLLYVWAAEHYGVSSLLWLLWLPVLIRHGYVIYRNRQQPRRLGEQLKVIVLSALMVNMLFALGVVI